MIFVILTCFYLAYCFGEEKFSALPSKNKVADEKKLVQSGNFSSATLFVEGSAQKFFFLEISLSNESTQSKSK
jgi:hypothetical protein